MEANVAVGEVKVTGSGDSTAILPSPSMSSSIGEWSLGSYATAGSICLLFQYLHVTRDRDMARRQVMTKLDHLWGGDQGDTLKKKERVKNAGMPR
jgi:hypothetical protein